MINTVIHDTAQATLMYLIMLAEINYVSQHVEAGADLVLGHIAHEVTCRARH